MQRKTGSSRMSPTEMSQAGCLGLLRLVVLDFFYKKNNIPNNA